MDGIHNLEHDHHRPDGDLADDEDFNDDIYYNNENCDCRIK